MFHITVQQGATRGATWALGEGVHRLGRGADCEIVVTGDNAVSRLQCELYVSGTTIRLRHRSDRSVTLLNGDVVQGESEVHAGDTLTVGYTTLLVSGMAHGSQGHGDTTPDLKTVSLNAGDSIFFGGRDAGRTLSRRVESLQDLVELFNLALVFSEAGDPHEMAACIRDAVASRFRPRHAWAVRLDGKRDAPLVLPGSDAAIGTIFEETIPAMRKSFTENRGLLLPQTVGEGSERQMRSTLVAPLSVGGAAIGVIALITETPDGLYADLDLQYLVALGRLLAPCIVTAEHTAGLVRENERLRASQAESGELLGASRAMGEVRAQLRQAARSPLSVLILGESGTGKELAAHFVHRHSSSAAGPYVAVNCAAIPAELVESELFGYEKGAFTGAAARRTGLVEQAHGGTLFLDEIGDLSLENQARVLRVLEDGSFRRLGGRDEIKVTFRLVAATNKDVPEMVEQGAFRSDLYHRINTFEVHIPPLRERPSDIPVLVEHFLNLAQGHANRPLRGITPEALDQLQRAAWPGNARELKNAVDRAVHTAQDDILTPADFSPRSEHGKGAGTAMISIEEAEKQHIAAVLEACSGDVEKAGPVLGVARSTLYKKIKKFGISL